ncbi:MAG: hypothetical protein JWO36_6167 [Myxococcales bacterium]|nr:hypothetical protein [Myxococcales bacterium]
MRVELTKSDAMFLRDQLARHLERLEDELVHTDKRPMQRSLAADAGRLRELFERMFGQVNEARTPTG